jgi:Calx-beta domain
MSSYYDEPNDSSSPLGNPRTVTIIVLVVAALVGIVGCVALYFFANGNRGTGAGQATQVVAVTSLPSSTASLTPIPTETPAPSATVTEDGAGGGGDNTATPDISGTLANIGGSRVATMDELRGLIQIRVTPDGTFQTVLSNVTIAPGTTVLSSENSSTKLTTTEGSIIRVSSQTQMTLTDLSGTKTNPVTTLSLDFGKVWTIVGGPLGTGKFEVVTPIGKAAILGSWMGVEHNSTEQIDIITCLEGKCRYSNDQGVQEMVTGQQLIVKAGQPLPDPEKMDAAQLADWAITKIPEVITLTPTATTTPTASATHTPTLTRTPRNTANAQATSDKSGLNTQIAATSTALAGANSSTQAANSNNNTATQKAANVTSTVFFFNATATAFYNSTQNSFTATSFAFTATSFSGTSRAQGTSGALTGTAVNVQNTAAAATVTAQYVNGQASQVAAAATTVSANLTATEAAIPYVNFDPASYSTAVPESSGQVTLTVRIAHPVSSNVNLLANLTSVGVNGSAAATGSGSLGGGGTQDFINTQISFFIPANQSTTTIVIPIADDGFAETNETFQVSLACNGACNSGAVIGTNLTSTVTIVNSSAPSVSFSSGSPSAAEGDSNSNASVAVTLSRAYANVNNVSVNYSILPGGTATGDPTTCGYPHDYLSTLSDDDGGTPGTLNFPVGTTTRNITIPICGDIVNEGDETIFLSLSSQVNASLGTASATFSIVDNDPIPTFTITTITSPVTEPTDAAAGNLGITFTVALSATPGRDVTVQYNTQDGTANAGTDYIGVSGTLTFLKDTVTLTQNVTVNVKGDALDEDDEAFSFVISNPTNANLGPTTSVNQIIQDNGNDGPPNVSFSNTPASVSESGGGASAVDCNNNASPGGKAYINVNLDLPSGKTVFVNYATSDGTALVPGDYFTTAGTLQFNPGEQCKSFLVTIVNDSVHENTEFLNLTLAGPVNATLSGSNPRQLFINDDDP